MRYLFIFLLTSSAYASEIVQTVAGQRATGYLGLGKNPKYSEEVFDTNDLPELFDWRFSGMVTPVRDQAQCGSCVSMAATKVFESALMIQGGYEEFNLAEQEMLSCRKGDANGCSGAYMTAPAYMSVHGQGLEKDFPYRAQNLACKKIPVVAKASSYKLLGSSNRKPTILEIKAALIKYGPLVVTAYAGGPGWSGKTGKITSCRKTNSTNHAITLIGYDKTGFIFRNSWSSNWGNKGDSWIGYGCDGFANEAGYYTIDPIEE